MTRIRRGRRYSQFFYSNQQLFHTLLPLLILQLLSLQWRGKTTTNTSSSSSWNIFASGFVLLPSFSLSSSSSSQHTFCDTDNNARISSSTNRRRKSFSPSCLRYSNDGQQDEQQQQQQKQQEEQHQKDDKYHSSSSSSSSSLFWTTTMSLNPDPHSAIREITKDLPSPLPSSSPPPSTTTTHIAFLFVNQYHSSSFPLIVTETHSILTNHTLLLSILSSGIISNNSSLNDPSLPVISLLYGTLPPGSHVRSFHFNDLTHPPPKEGDDPLWKEIRGDDLFDESRCSRRRRRRRRRPPSLILFADPWITLSSILAHLSHPPPHTSPSHHHLPAIIAGAISTPPPNSYQPSLALQSILLPQGSLVGLSLHGTLGLQTVISQGCRPVGPTMRVTEKYRIPQKGGVVGTLDGERAIEVLMRVTEEARRRCQKKKNHHLSEYLLCGISSNGGNDYLMRQIIGFQPKKGAIILSGYGTDDVLRTGDIFRFKKVTHEIQQLLP